MDEDRLIRLLAYVDGELPADERAAFEAEMACDPALAGEVEAHRELAGAVAGAYAPVLDEPVPVALAAAASVANDRGRVPALPRWAAVAAALVVGVLVGRVALAPERGGLVQTPQGLTARGELAQGLTTALAADAGQVRVGLTFRDADRRWCRTFQSRPDRLAGVACRDGGDWRIQTAAAWTPQGGPQYRTAASETPSAVLAAVDALRASDPVDAAAERAARDSGWR